MSEPTTATVFYTDEAKAAMTDGAFMLRDALRRLDASWGDDVAERMAEIRKHAEQLEAMVASSNLGQAS